MTITFAQILSGISIASSTSALAHDLVPLMPAKRHDYPFLTHTSALLHLVLVGASLDLLRALILLASAQIAPCCLLLGAYLISNDQLSY